MESFSRAIVGFMVNIQRMRGNGFKLPRVWFEKGGTNKKNRGCNTSVFFLANPAVLCLDAERK